MLILLSINDKTTISAILLSINDKIQIRLKKPAHPCRILPIFNTTQIATPQHLTT